MLSVVLDKFLLFTNQKSSSLFIKLRLFPKEIRNPPDGYNLSQPDDRMALIIQGPILYENKFTLQTIKWYQAIFPKTVIILSTWKSQDLTEIEYLASENLIILKHDLPENSGILNFNYQLKSTLAALKYVNLHGFKFAIKTRTDQRIHNKDILFLLKDRASALPGISDTRLVICDTFSLLNRPLHYSDMLMFGSVTDMLDYWDVPQMEINLTREKFEQGSYEELTTEDMIESGIMCPEIYLGLNYAINKYGLDAVQSPSHAHHKLLKNYVTFVDYAECGIFWPKYTTKIPLGWYQLPRDLEPLTYSRWCRFIAQNE